jgi:hypothetical protein
MLESNNMSWELESKKHFVEVTRQTSEGDEYTDSREYTPGTYSSDVSLYLGKEDKQLVVVPFVMEVFYHDVDISAPEATTNRLLVGIRDDELLTFFGRLWTSHTFKDQRIEQYFFRNDQPSAFNLGMMSGPGWPLNHGAIVGAQEFPYLQALKAERPQITRSLGNCLPHLMTPGIEYGTAPHGSISFSLDLNRRGRKATQ